MLKLLKNWGNDRFCKFDDYIVPGTWESAQQAFDAARVYSVGSTDYQLDICPGNQNLSVNEVNCTSRAAQVSFNYWECTVTCRIYEEIGAPFGCLNEFTATATTRASPGANDCKRQAIAIINGNLRQSEPEQVSSLPTPPHAELPSMLNPIPLHASSPCMCEIGAENGESVDITAKDIDRLITSVDGSINAGGFLHRDVYALYLQFNYVPNVVGAFEFLSPEWSEASTTETNWLAVNPENMSLATTPLRLARRWVRIPRNREFPNDDFAYRFTASRAHHLSIVGYASTADNGRPHFFYEGATAAELAELSNSATPEQRRRDLESELEKRATEQLGAQLAQASCGVEVPDNMFQSPPPPPLSEDQATRNGLFLPQLRR